MNTRVLFAMILGVGLSVVAGSFANAGVVAYEGFDFTAARLDGSIACRGTDLAGWYPYGGWGNCNISVPEGSGMNYSNLVTKGNAAVGVVGSSGDIRAYRDLAEKYTDGEFWISFLLLSNATGYDYAYANLNLCDSQFPVRNGERVAFGFTYRHTQEYGQRWEPDIPGHGYTGTGITRKDVPALVVVKYDFGTGYDGSSSLYIDPPLGPDPPAWPDAYEGGIDKWDMPFDRIRVELHQDPPGSLLMLDEIRIGETWADVTPIPEPSTVVSLFALGVMCTLTYVWQRRRRRLQLDSRRMPNRKCLVGVAGRSTITAIGTLTALLVLPILCLADVTPIVDGPDSIDGSDSLIIVRENYFDSVDLSQLGLLDEVRPVNFLSPNPPPWGSSTQTNVQSLLIRGGGAENVRLAGTISFSSEVSILGGVTDVADIWGNVGGSPSQLVEAENIFGVGMNYGRLGLRRYEASGIGANQQDAFLIDRVANTVTFSVVTNMAAFSDDLHLLISYGDHYAPGQSFDVALTTGDGLNVGADFLGPGQQFTGVPLTIPEPSTIVLLSVGAVGLLAHAWRRRKGA